LDATVDDDDEGCLGAVDVDFVVVVVVGEDDKKMI